jgi:hypothetical protein
MTRTTTTASIQLGNRNQTSTTIPEQPAQSSNQHRSSSNEPEDVVVQQLEPADGGTAAWRLLIAAFIFEALLWGT